MREVSRRIPWRNGLGTTLVLAESDGGEPLEWRISVAEIAGDCPFSDYSGYERTIVAQDAGFTLEFTDGERVRVEPLVPFRFGGERAVFCRLDGAPASAFNVMTLRGAFAHEVSVRDGEIDVRLIDLLDEGPDAAGSFETFDEWERARRTFATWEALVKLRFAQDVRNQRARDASAALARRSAHAQRRDAEMKQRLLEPEHAAALEHRLGSHILARWKQDLFALDPAIEPMLSEESRLYDEYTRLTAGARYRFHGEEHSAASLGAFARHADRALRREANLQTWRFYETHADELDRIFSDLLSCRTQMAQRLGRHSYTQLSYERLGRTDYAPRDVEALRESIARHFTPLCAKIVERQAMDLGIEAVMPWDELVFDAGPALAAADRGILLDSLTNAFGSAHPDLGRFAEDMASRGFFDLAPRKDKRAGAFCSYFPALNAPYVFANCTGTAGDVMSLVHEMGHAYQDYSSRRQPVLEYIVPPAETGEIFSLGLEYLLWPHYEAFFGGDAPRYRSAHVKSMLLMLPYIAAIDHFQQDVYDNPEASAQERRGMWLACTQRYMPYRHSGAVPHLVRGGAWQRQHHVYGFPFYYIDYALALFAAFGLWRSSLAQSGTMERFLEMAALGGSLPFRTLLRTGGIADPFEDGTVSALAAFMADSPDVLTAAP